ncbi:MAG: nitrogen fixation protein NifM [Pseudomonadota bacterium]|jgi:nitrogen fixation protein NifM
MNEGVLAYHVLRVALEKFTKPPRDLDEAQLSQIRQQAEQTFDLESRVLATPEAQMVVVDIKQLDQAVETVRARYSNENDFFADLHANHLNYETLRSALFRELKFDAVMRLISSQIPDITTQEIESFYHQHKEKFSRPERRRARQILITTNEQYPENQYDNAKNRLINIANELKQHSHLFEEYARKYSECPSALQGGLLGDIPRHHLYPALDVALFELQRGEISSIVESSLGFHLLFCEEIFPAEILTLEQVSRKIYQHLQNHARQTYQRAWLKQRAN